MNSRLPDVIGIGTRRCGTSWIHKCLNAHPGIGKPENGLHFFSEHYGKGVGWYREQLRPHANRRTLVELSVSYSYPEHYAEVAARLAETVPDARLFISIRNPVERAFSDYRRSINRLEFSKNLPFERAVTEHPELLMRGLYGRVLQEYLRYFPKERVAVLFFDDLERDAQAFLDPLWQFLGVDALPAGVVQGIRDGSARAIRWQGYAQGIFWLKGLAQRGFLALGQDRAWDRFTRRFMGAYHALLSLNERDLSVSEKTRRELGKYYADDIGEIEQITGRRLDDWK